MIVQEMDTSMVTGTIVFLLKNERAPPTSDDRGVKNENVTCDDRRSTCALSNLNLAPNDSVVVDDVPSYRGNILLELEQSTVSS